jgi:PPOX class F420-dependent enzyme/OxyR family protein
MFSEKEIAYLRSQRLARIATASEEHQPDVAPVGFEFDGTYFYVGGINLPATLKYKNIQKNPKVSLVIDDLESISPWTSWYQASWNRGPHQTQRIRRCRDVYQDRAQRAVELGNRRAGDQRRQVDHEEKQSDS